MIKAEWTNKDALEGDLISRHDATEAVVCHIWHTPDETRKLFNCENYVRDIVEEALRELPSADRPKGDWVEVVRCKDCKHMKYAIDKGKNGMCGVHSALIIMNGNDYCSYGERKEE